MERQAATTHFYCIYRIQHYFHSFAEHDPVHSLLTFHLEFCSSAEIDNLGMLKEFAAQGWQRGKYLAYLHLVHVLSK